MEKYTAGVDEYLMILKVSETASSLMIKKKSLRLNSLTTSPIIATVLSLPTEKSHNEDD